MTTRRAALLLTVILAIAAGFSVPAALALPTCQDVGTTTTCRTNGSVSIKARPGTLAPPPNQAGIRWGGSGFAVNFGR